MKHTGRLLATGFAAILLLATATPAGAGGGGGGGGGKVTLCHVSTAQTLTVEQAKVSEHLRHGDYSGACSSITVKKVLSPSSDRGKFNLAIDAKVYAANVGDGGTSGARAVTPGVQHSASESAGTATNLADYTSSYVCKDGTKTLASGNGVTTGPLPKASSGHGVVCTFTNAVKKVNICKVSKSSPYAQTLAVYPKDAATYVAGGGYLGVCSTLSVKKVLSPSTNKGKFNLKIDTTAYATNVGNGGSTGARPVTPGVQHSASESAGTSTSLANYASSFVCKDGSTTIASGAGTTTGPLPAAIASHDVVCTFTNTPGRPALPAHLIIAKRTNPGDDPTLFTFDPGTGFGSEPNFQLTDGTTKDFTLTAGTYSVAELETAGWTNTTVGCDDNSSQSSPTATVTLAAGQTVSCTFTNIKEQAKPAFLIVDKRTDPVGDLTQFTFDPGTGFGSEPNFQLADASTPKEFTLAVGTYSVQEVGAEGWTLTGRACSDGSTQTSSGGITVTLTAGQIVTCTFTNTKEAHLAIDKVTEPAGDTTAFTFDPGAGFGSEPNFQLADATKPRNFALAPGTYAVTEIATAGWRTAVSCSDGSSQSSPTATVTLGAGRTVTCTFTNTQDPSLAHLIIDKVTTPASDPTVFHFLASLDLGPGFDLADETAPHDFAVGPGSYSVQEVVSEGWVLTGRTCDDGSSQTGTAGVTVHLTAGQTVTCTFTNAKQAHLIIDKVTDPPNDPTVFTFDPGAGFLAGEPNFQLADATKPLNFALAPGTYSVAELATVGWGVTVSCSDGSSQTGASATVTLGAGQTVTCTFTNHLLPSEE